MTDVYTLINTMGGERLAGTYASIEFHGSNGAYFEKVLDGMRTARVMRDSSA